MAVAAKGIQAAFVGFTMDSSKILTFLYMCGEEIIFISRYHFIFGVSILISLILFL